MELKWPHPSVPPPPPSILAMPKYTRHYSKSDFSHHLHQHHYHQRPQRTMKPVSGNRAVPLSVHRHLWRLPGGLHARCIKVVLVISIHPQSPANHCNGSCRLYLSTVAKVLVVGNCLHSPLCYHHSDQTLNKLWQKILRSPTSSGGLPATERLLFSTSKPRILEMTLLIADYMNMMGVVNLPKTSTRSTIHSRSVSRSRLQVGKHKMLTNRKITSAVYTRQISDMWNS